MFEKCFEKAFRFDFVMIHVGMYTKCSEMFCFLKRVLNLTKVCGVKSILIEQATKSLITYSELVVFMLFYVSFRILLSIPLVGR